MNTSKIRIMRSEGVALLYVQNKNCFTSRDFPSYDLFES